MPPLSRFVCQLRTDLQICKVNKSGFNILVFEPMYKMFEEKIHNKGQSNSAKFQSVSFRGWRIGLF